MLVYQSVAFYNCQTREKVENGMVYFSVKDYKRNGIFRKMKLEIDESANQYLRYLFNIVTSTVFLLILFKSN